MLIKHEEKKNSLMLFVQSLSTRIMPWLKVSMKAEQSSIWSLIFLKTPFNKKSKGSSGKGVFCSAEHYRFLIKNINNIIFFILIDISFPNTSDLCYNK